MRRCRDEAGQLLGVSRPGELGRLPGFGLCAGSGCRRGGGGANRASGSLDGREIIVPIPGAERLRIDNPLGNITVKAWGRAETMHIVADKQSSSPEALARLRVHFIAWAGGEISIEVRVDAGGRERALPLSASRVDLTIEVPAELGVEAKTFGGDLAVSGLRAGARLETTAGRIAISDVHGRVSTHQLRGGQKVVAVEGDVDSGWRRGSHAAGSPGRDTRGGAGGGRRHPGGRRALGRGAPVGHHRGRGAVGRPSPARALRFAQLQRRGAAFGGGGATGFELRTRSPVPVKSSMALTTLWQKGDRARSVTPPARSDLTSPPGRPIVELSSVLGRVVIESAHLVDRLQLADKRTLRC